jgi:hypothetical protein
MEAQGMRKEMPEIPTSLNVPAFLECWADWVEYRNQLRKPLTSIGVKTLFKRLESWGADKSVRALSRSMENGWQGVFDPEGEPYGNGISNGRSNGNSARTRRGGWDALPAARFGPAPGGAATNPQPDLPGTT